MAPKPCDSPQPPPLSASKILRAISLTLIASALPAVSPSPLHVREGSKVLNCLKHGSVWIGPRCEGGQAIGLRLRRLRGLGKREKERNARDMSVKSSEMDYAVIRFKIPGVDEKKLPGYLGVLGLAALAWNHLGVEGDVEAAQLRSEALGALMALGCLSINPISTALDEAQGKAERPPPPLGSEQMLAISEDLSDSAKLELAWATASLLLNTNVHRVILLRDDGKVVAARGFFQKGVEGKQKLLATLSNDFKNLGIQASSAGYYEDRNQLKSSTLMAESTSIALKDAQSAVLSPVGKWGTLLGVTDAPKAIRPKDRTWISLLADKLASDLPLASSEAETETQAGVKNGGKAATTHTNARMGTSQGTEDASQDSSIVGANPGVFRALPLATGFPGLLALLANRFLSGTTPTESVTQADLVAFPLGVVLTLTGLIWSDRVKARIPVPVDLSEDSIPTLIFSPSLPDASYAKQELSWAWKAIATATRCKSLVIMSAGGTILQAGLAKKGKQGSGAPVEPNLGPVCSRALASGQGTYIPNLVLNSGRGEFTYLPEKTQGVLVKPLLLPGVDGGGAVMVLGTDTVRGFTSVDQAWVAAVSEKLGSTFAGAESDNAGSSGSAAGVA